MDTTTGDLFAMARKIANKYSRKHNRDDCISVAYAATVIALAVEPKGADRMAWVASAVHHKVRRFIMFDSLIRNKSRLKENFVIVQSIGKFEPVVKQNNFVRGLIEEIIEDDIDQIIVDYREQNFDDLEIAEKIGKSRAFVQKRRSMLRSRFDKLYAVS